MSSMYYKEKKRGWPGKVISTITTGWRGEVKRRERPGDVFSTTINRLPNPIGRRGEVKRRIALECIKPNMLCGRRQQKQCSDTSKNGTYYRQKMEFLSGVGAENQIKKKHTYKNQPKKHVSAMWHPEQLIPHAHLLMAPIRQNYMACRRSATQQLNLFPQLAVLGHPFPVKDAQ